MKLYYSFLPISLLFPRPVYTCGFLLSCLITNYYVCQSLFMPPALFLVFPLSLVSPSLSGEKVRVIIRQLGTMQGGCYRETRERERESGQCVCMFCNSRAGRSSLATFNPHETDILGPRALQFSASLEVRCCPLKQPNSLLDCDRVSQFYTITHNPFGIN